ncbi:D-alanyl-D-alanine carboxypeptidase [Auraticoccus monumenti]|uniref:D-alanyl-D-alanine carboxypeptidase n=1 Tax=Auraticoccus monumenti TaxID=675864 RepID=A0A1G7EKS3_9ACTN|nr:D-alanyl-D-alanine carboxypeptidase [Auraticoccus monumenti]
MLVLAVTLTAVLGARTLEGSSPAAGPSSEVVPTVTGSSVDPDHEPDGGPDAGPPRSEGASGEGVGAGDGRLASAVTVDDERFPALTRLDPALLDALREAATDASGSGTTFLVTSGWRSRAYQQQLLDQAVATYGSEQEAARWVATPETSPHVSGEAVDLGPDAATAWLSEHGSRYGLCQVYANEPWHYELRPDAVEHGCPTSYPDPTHDPRMQG